MKISVKQGIIHVNSVYVMSMSDNHVYLEADTKQKYPEVCMVSEFQVYVGANERTLRVEDASLFPTEITIEGLEADRWRMITETGRYNVAIILAKYVCKDEEKYEHLTWYDEKR